jgi:hypothetical protein
VTIPWAPGGPGPDGATGSELPDWAVWLAWAALLAPFIVLAHELAHFVAGAVLGFPDLALHHDSVTHTADEAGFPLWQQGLVDGAGPLLSLLLVALCALAASKRGTGPVLLGIALPSGIRTVGLGAAYLLHRLRHPGVSLDLRVDEGGVAHAAGISPAILLGVGTLAVLALWAYLVRGVPGDGRLRRVVSSAAGTALGVLLHLTLLGPLLLP